MMLRAKMLRLAVLASVTLLHSWAAAQSLTAGGVTVDAQSGILASAQNQTALGKLTKNAYGRPCISILAEARPLINNLFSHVVIASNGCSVPLKISACYVASRDCVAALVPPRGRKELLLGNFPGAKNFRFEFREVS